MAVLKATMKYFGRCSSIPPDVGVWLVVRTPVLFELQEKDYSTLLLAEKGPSGNVTTTDSHSIVKELTTVTVK